MQMLRHILFGILMCGVCFIRLNEAKSFSLLMPNSIARAQHAQSLDPIVSSKFLPFAAIRVLFFGHFNFY